jgi:hypothetical protein
MKNSVVWDVTPRSSVKVERDSEDHNCCPLRWPGKKPGRSRRLFLSVSCLAYCSAPKFLQNVGKIVPHCTKCLRKWPSRDPLALTGNIVDCKQDCWLTLNTGRPWWRRVQEEETPYRTVSRLYRALAGHKMKIFGFSWLEPIYNKPYLHLWADCLEDVGASTSHTPMGLRGLLEGQLYLCISGGPQSGWLCLNHWGQGHL